MIYNYIPSLYLRAAPGGAGAGAGRSQVCDRADLPADGSEGPGFDQLYDGLYCG